MTTSVSMSSPESPSTSDSGYPRRPTQQRIPSPSGLCQNNVQSVSLDDSEPVADYLNRWFEAKAPRSQHRPLRTGVAATVRLTVGVTTAVVSKMLRHKNVTTTIDLYDHLSQPAGDRHDPARIAVTGATGPAPEFLAAVPAMAAVPRLILSTEIYV